MCVCVYIPFLTTHDLGPGCPERDSVRQTCAGSTHEKEERKEGRKEGRISCFSRSLTYVLCSHELRIAKEKDPVLRIVGDELHLAHVT